jgi:hypothetical protein
MATPIFTEEEISSFKKRLQEIETDRLTFPDYHSREAAKNIVNNAFFAQAVSRISQDRIEDFINYLLIIVGSKGERGDIPVWQGFSHADNEAYLNILKGYENPLNRRYLHMFLKAILVAHRNWALTAFVKFLRGNKVAGGKADKLEGFGYFHKDSGWNEAQVRSVALILFDDWSTVSKLFMQYDSKLKERVSAESDDNWNIPYSAQFAATSKTINEELIKAIISALEKRDLAPLPTDPKKAFKERIPKIFKPGDLIRKNEISDLPPLSLIEIKVKKRLKRGDENAPGTVQIILVSPAQPRCYLNIWRVADGKAYLTGNDFSSFDHDRKCLEGAIYQGQWEEGVQAQKGAYRYPYDYIGLL